MRFFRPLLIMCVLFGLSLTIVHAQAPDADGDGIPDSQDFCWLVPGVAEYHGCNADNFPDFDHDGVGDPVDTCVDQPGPASNSGCPIGVTPDADLDGVPDSQDACPREAGPADNQGCPPDSDKDGIPDVNDACPQQAGTGDNLGCPQGVTPPDSDGDGVPDLMDACPQQAGSSDLGGCPDSDGDGVPDNYDACPNQPGESDLFGCAPVTSTTLPGSLAALTSADAASAAKVAQLTVGLPRFGLGGSVLAVRASDNLLTYDLSVGQLAPLTTTNTGWSGYPVAVSSDGAYLATLEFPKDFSTPPFAQIRRGADGSPLYQIASQPGADGSALGISAFAFNPVLPLLAIGETSSGGLGNSTVPTSLLLWDVANNRQAGQLSMPSDVTNLAFSGDGHKLAADTVDNGSMAVYLWDVGAQTKITSFTTTPILHFIGTPLALNGDGSQIAVGYPDGSFSLWHIDGANATQQYSVQLFNQAASEVISAVAFSPDGSLVAVAGGVPFSGGLTGKEQFPIFLLDTASGKTLARLDGQGSLIHDLAFDRDGHLLISAGDSSVKFWGVGG